MLLGLDRRRRIIGGLFVSGPTMRITFGRIWCGCMDLDGPNFHIVIRSTSGESGLEVRGFELLLQAIC